MNVNIVEDRPFALESPINAVEGDLIQFSCSFWDAVTGTPTAVAYRNGTDVTATVFPAGAITVSDNVVVLKRTAGLVGGSRYVIAITAVIGGDTFVRKITLIVARDEQE